MNVKWLLPINGTKSKVQSSIDFYLNMISTRDYGSIEDLKRSFFNKFMEEYRESRPSLEELAFDGQDKTLVSSSDEIGADQMEVPYSESTEELKGLEETVEVEDVKEESISAPAFLQMLQEKQSQYHQEQEDTQEVEVEEYRDNDSSIEDEDVEWVSSGVDIDELEFEEESVEEEVQQEDSTGEIEWDEEDSFDSDEYSRGAEVEEDNTEKQSEIEWDEDEEGSSESEESFEWDEPEETIDETDIESEIKWDEPEEDTSSFEIEWDEDTDEVLENYSEEGNFEEEPEVEQVKDPPENSQSNNLGSKREVSMEDDGMGADIPSDIREFLRQHPNSDIAYVQKFYPKKEIDKQLKMGRIYKRRGKLMI